MIMNPFSLIKKYLVHYKLPMIAGVIYIMFMTIFQILAPWLLRYTIDYISFSHNKSNVQLAPILSKFISLFPELKPAHTLSILVILMVFIVFIQGIFRYLMRKTMIGVSRKIEYDMRNDYIAHLQKLSQTFYFRQKTGDLMARATNDLNAVRSMLGPGIMHLVSTFFVFFATLTFMIQINFKLTLWAIIPLPLVVFSVHGLLAKIHVMFERIQAQFSTITSNVEENITGIRVIKSYVQEEPEIENFKNQNNEYITRNLELAKVRSLLRAQIHFFLGLGIILILWVGGRFAIKGNLTLGGLVAFFAYLSMLAWPMIAIGWVLNLWQQGLASLKRMISIWQEKPDIKDDSQTDHSITGIEGHIEFKDLVFFYDKDQAPVLNNINLTVPKGSTLAIIGPTGSGKSTLVNLLPRLTEAQGGHLLIDGHDIQKLPLSVLRQNIGYVPQESFLFSETIAENIAFGVDYEASKEIEQAAEISQIKLDFDQFPEGFETMVGERGITLSGGQKQRTAISRAVIRQPKILILDDALSAVDTYTEKEILIRLKKVMQNCTSIIVAHRISTVRDADQIIFLADGQIIEQGTHEQLLKLKSHYYKLYQRQQLEQSLAEL